MPFNPAGNTPSTATELNTTIGQQTFTEQLSALNPQAYYRFSFSQRSSYSIVLSDLGADLNLQLLNSSGTVLQTSANTSGMAEAIGITLDAGTYYIRVYPTSNGITSPYTLNFTNQVDARPELLWRDYSSGRNVTWFMNGTNNTNIASFAELNTVPTNWRIEGVADFNNDNRPDLVWRDYNSGRNVTWFMNGNNNTNIASFAELNTVPTNWRIEGVADFNNDNRPDLVWRDYSSGRNAVWLMGGTNNTSIVAVNDLISVSTNWQIGGVADFNNDNRPDLVWRDYSSGRNLVWLMGGTNNTSIASVAELVNIPVNWRIEGTADFNNDNRPDILWRETGTGRNVVWVMGGTNNTSIVAVNDLTPLSTNWQLSPYTRYGEPAPIDQIGNTTTTAFNIGTVNGGGTYRDRLTTLDSNDYYRFDLAASSSLSLTLNDLSGDAELQLYNQNGSLVQSSNNPGNIGEAINLQLLSGTYYVRVASFAGVDTNYTLNIATSPAVVDLRGAFFDVTPQPLTAGNSFTASFRVQNNSVIEAGAFRVGFYVSGDNTISTNDRLLGFYDITTLAASTTTSLLTQALTLPSSIDPFWFGNRTYYIGMVVDAQNALSESNETNNANLGNSIDWDDVSITVPIPQADLRGALFDAPELLSPGTSYSLNFQLQNNGNSNAGAFTVGFYLSSDSTIGTSDRFLGFYNAASLATGATTATLTQNITLPAATDAFWSGTRTYYIGMIVDMFNTVAESNETNNSNRGNTIDWDDVTVTIVPPQPDLRGSFFDVTLEPLTIGNTFTTNFQIQNAGTSNAGAFRVAFYLSTDNTITPDDRLLSTTDIASLAAGSTTATLAQSLTLPGSSSSFWVGSRTYYIGMIVDSLGAVTESDEGNNSNRGNTIDWDDVAITVTQVITDPTVALVNATGTLAIDALLAASPFNYYWNTSSNGGIIPYSFYRSTAGAYYGTETVSELSDAIKTNVRHILASLESYVNVRFVEVPDTSSSYGVLRYMFSNGPGYAYAYYPSSNRLGGDVHLSSAYESDLVNRFSGGLGSYGYETLIHETFHALGLKHPGNYNGSGTGEGPFLAGGDDHNTNTVMTYNNAGESAITPMAYDIRALQYLYGARSNNASATTYNFSTVFGYSLGGQVFGSTSTALKQAIWDSGGTDTLDFSGLATSATYRFDLRQGGMLTTQAAFNSASYNDVSGNGVFTTTSLGTAIAYNTVIENLVNSRSSDYIIANSANNVFSGYNFGTATGTDVIEGGNLSDVLSLSGYTLTNLTPTVSGTDLTIGLGSFGSVSLRNYLATGGAVRILVGGTYYTYNGSTWVATTPPALPGFTIMDNATTGLTATIPILSGDNSIPAIACNCPICTARPNLNQLGETTLASLVGAG